METWLYFYLWNAGSKNHYEVEIRHTWMSDGITNYKTRISETFYNSHLDNVLQEEMPGGFWYRIQIFESVKVQIVASTYQDAIEDSSIRSKRKRK